MSERYKDNGDGTVTDLTTGLMWEKKVFTGGYTGSANPHDMFNIYSWGNNPGTFGSGQGDTNDFLKTLNDQRFANHSDWRLAIKPELLEIVDHSQPGNPRIDPILGGNGGFYWSADQLDDPPGYAWAVNFANFRGPEWESRAVGVGGNNCVRAVRGHVTTSLFYGETYQIRNGYNGFGVWRLVAGPGGCADSLSHMQEGDNINCVSCISYPDWTVQKYGRGSLWTITGKGKAPGTRVMFGDVIHLHAGQANGQQRVGVDQLGGYLDICGGPCQDNPFCVSTSGTTNRASGSGSWRILLTEGDQGGGQAHHGQEVHLRNGFNNWNAGYLDTRGSEGGYLCVSAHATWNGVDSPETTKWKFVLPGQLT